ncbi:SigE family RNA polymerase sigma factor [Kutzneria viridogrisea]|uniref:RNA polymerase, sigma-24 subunit, ECF subfamily n=2 Tax=Kutzneria TaxID=43356 RepID=W5VY31_9PSEU|nr:SigE family RNA polymerase sigma factor [Kutzneria albida]AHH93477.1 RNA polymerase, sigma-24 subunit, ECF subfamily [Kutzneria albida DSM 43870]MBA8929137.1 RNA polymerase sigma-70 factor (sigma-E family) [Kutzneria viridogrisea]
MAQRDESFAEFFTSRFDSARRTAHALCGNWLEAEEIAQSAFVSMYGRWNKVRIDSADAYLHTVLTRTFLDTKRRGRRREQVVADPPDQAVQPDLSASEDRPSLLAALQEVPPRQRAVLVLRFVRDLSVEEVAETLGCTTGTVKSQTARGLATLRKAYGAVTGDVLLLQVAG